MRPKAANSKGMPAPVEKPGLHPRNPHRLRYDFARLVAASPELGAYVRKNPYGDVSIDYADASAVRALNRALLKSEYGIAHWELPPGFLCPPVPGRADYLHHLADLLAESRCGAVPRGASVRVLDVGTGASVIYPLIGHRAFGWSFVGSDINPKALVAAQQIVDANGLSGDITLRGQKAPAILQGLLRKGEHFDLSMCNPPFHASEEEALAGSRRKWRNLGRGKPGNSAPVRNFGGRGGELWCEGGEAAFVRRMIEESAEIPMRCLWFTTLVSKSSDLPSVVAVLKKVRVREQRVINMLQGQKQSRIVAWTFSDLRDERP